MSIDINLLNKKKRSNRDTRAFLIVYGILMGVLGIYFLGSVIYVVYGFYQVNQKTTAVNQEATTVSQLIRSKNETVTKYVLAKSILDYYDSLQQSKFQYKDYLDQIVQILPPEVILTNVDFANKGWVAISVQLPGITSLEMFEQKFTDSGILTNTMFESVFVEGATRDKEGKYLIKMQFALKKNG